MSVEGSPEQSPPEPGEDAAEPLKTKPLPRVNAVAREVRVKVTGARPVNVTGERELFTESTTTVLVFEKGAVIHLTAAVTPGQLLFLTNEESKREVVAQVTRKRTFRPTECYAELEFIESAPGFWGMEFSAATALLPKDAKEIAAAELIASAETTEDELEEAAPPPSADEVQALKKEVDALRSQLNLLQAQPEPATPPAAAIPDTAVVPAVEVAPKAEATTAPAEPAPSFGHTSESSAIETTPEHKWISAAGEEFLQQPTMDFHIPVPKRKRSFRARGQFTPGFRTGMLRVAVLSIILAALVGTAWYKHWLPWMKEQESKKISVASWAGSVTTAAPMPEVRPTSPSPAAVGTPQVKSGNDIPPASAPAAESSQPAALPDKTPSEIATGNENEKGMDSSLPTLARKKRAAREKKVPPVLMAKSSPPPALPAKAVNSTATSASNPILRPPKLIKSERAAASLDDLRDFETGSVVIDAIIDTAGDVTSPNVLSGPPSLRRPALEALKHYKYDPATLNGKPVPAHVTVKIQFHFE